MLKTDDDCYIRYPALAATVLQPPVGKAAVRKSRVQAQMRGVYKGVRSPGTKASAHAKKLSITL